MKRFFKQLFCRHKEKEVLRWHYTHGPNGNMPNFIEIETKCKICKKVDYYYIFNKHEMLDFANEYKDKQW